MEILTFSFHSNSLHTTANAVLCGVVGSGNLEVLMQSGGDKDVCHITITTSTRGFAETWHAVLAQFAAEHAVGGVHITINDMGATPAVVTLRLSQGLVMYCGVI